MVKDQYGRHFKSLRVSLSGECNLACEYCVPGKRHIRDPSNELNANELFNVIKLLTNTLDIEKIRLTGGEPLISPKLDNILPRLADFHFKDISLTTNAQILKERIPFLQKHGIKRLNVSLDTLDRDRFTQITRGGELRKTLEGIEASLTGGIKIRVNMVPIRGINEDEVLDVLDYCLDRNMELRYIELMQMGHMSDRQKFEKKFIPIRDIFDKIRHTYSFVPAESPIDSTANRYLIKNRGFFGVIANDSAPFCRSCKRLRLGSDGYIRGCLSSTERFSLKELTSQPETIAQKKLEIILDAALATKQDYSFSGSVLEMKQVGG